MFTKPVVAKEIIEIISKSKQNNSHGNHDIGNFVVKRVAPKISEPLAMVFSCSFSTGVFPHQLKLLRSFQCIFKKGQRSYIF